MKRFLESRNRASKGAALMIVLALVVLSTGLALAYFSRTTADRQLAQTSYNDTSADLLARSALDIVVGDFKQEILNNRTISRSNIQPSPYPTFDRASLPNLIRYSSRNAAVSRASNVSSTDASANGRSISTALWNSHYLVPLLQPAASPANSIPVAAFTAPDWVLVTAGGPTPAPSPGGVIGRYAFAVYDEGGLLDMSLAGYPNWGNVSNCADPAPTPWLVNVGRKGIVAMADLTALGSPAPLSQNQVDKIVGWRNYSMTQQPGNFFPAGNPSFPADCDRQNFYGSYLLYFGDPPFSTESLLDKLAASTYPFSSVPSNVHTPAGSPPRTDQSLVTRQQLLKLRSTLGFSQNVLQYMGTFSRERNWPAPDWPNLNGDLSEGRFNMNNLALVIPNPVQCSAIKGKKTGWYKGKARNKLCGTVEQVTELFGLRFVPSVTIDSNEHTPGYWKYVDHTGPNPPGGPDPDPHSIICFRGANKQNDFFQILHYALNVMRNEGTRCPGIGTQPRTFAIGASLIDQYDNGGLGPGGGCEGFTQWGNPARQPAGCDLDVGVADIKYATHTTRIRFGQGGVGSSTFAYGMEPDYPYPNGATKDGDVAYDVGNNSAPHRPCGGNKGGDCAPGEGPAPVPNSSTYVLNHAFTNVGEFGYGIDTSGVTGPNPLPSPVPLLKFWDPTNSPPRYPFQDAPVLDFFGYNPISSAYPRAGITNLYTRNMPVIAAMLKSALKQDSITTPSSSIIISQDEAMNAADAIVNEAQRVLAGSPTYGSVQQTDLTRAIAGRLAKAAADRVSSLNASDETRNTVARALAEMGQTRTWNLLVDVIAQTGRYAQDATDVSQANKFIVEGEKRYWLHIALGRDLIKIDPNLGTVPCQSGDTGCQVDVLGTQLEEVIE